MTPTQRLTRGSLAAFVLLLQMPMSAHAGAGSADAADLSLEDLLRSEVVTVSRKSQSLQSTAAAAFVITHEDIERFGATSLPEALRMAPGVEVARISSNRWAVSARGFNDRFSNKLLVLVDGRSIYSPLFSGVVWEAEDTSLDNVDRIEVIRGPGAALWGANAVNGVINIITLKARDTQGDLLVASAGDAERASLTYRHGGEVPGGHYRLWAKAIDRAPSATVDGTPGNDAWHTGRAGFRRDWSPAAGDRFVLSGEAYAGANGDRWNEPDLTSAAGYTRVDVQHKVHGAHLLGRRDWLLASGAEAGLQSYIDYSDILVQGAIRQARLTLDIDYQQRSLLDARNDFIWGLGYRFSTDRIATEGILAVTPSRASMSLFSAFVQDEITMIPEQLHLVAGARLEHNSYTGFEPQPNLRMIWTPNPNQSVWGALSHAVRTPSRSEMDSQLDLSVTPAQPPTMPLPVLVRSAPVPGEKLGSEKVDTAEIGYRQQFGSNLSLDLAAFYSRYRHLRSVGLGSVQFEMAPQPHVLQLIGLNNLVTAHTQGVEASLDWHPVPGWRLQPGWSLLRMSASADNGDPATQADATRLMVTTPRQQWSLRSSFNLGNRQQADLALRRVSALGTVDLQGHRIDAYTTLDARYAWRPLPALEIALVGQNLLQRRHAEFIPELLPSQTLQIERSFYVKARYQF